MSNDERCNDCGAFEGEMHHPACSLREPVRYETVNSAELTFRSSPVAHMYLVQIHDDNGKEIGSIEVDQETHQLRFNGNLDEAAKQFAKFAAAHFQSIMQGDRDGLSHDKIWVDEAAEIQHKYDGAAFHDVGLRREDKFGRF